MTSVFYNIIALSSSDFSSLGTRYPVPGTLAIGLTIARILYQYTYNQQNI